MKMISKSTFATLSSGLMIGLSISAVAAPASFSVNLGAGTGKTEFLAVGHPSALKVVGKGSVPTGELILDAKKITGSATFDIRSLDTGIDIRNEHMKKKYLEVEKFPNAVLKVTKLDLPPASGTGEFSANTLPFSGTLSLHGVEKAVVGTADLTRKAGQLNLAVKFGVKISDYAISSPGYAGITMADEVQITVSEIAPIAKR
jgi:polyisoprenoid-binding protein YceI